MAFVAGQHDIGGLVQQGPHPSVPAFRDAADVVDLGVWWLGACGNTPAARVRCA